MGDPIEIHRKEVLQRVQMANSQGGWEGTHNDFKRQMASTPRDLAKLIKHILAFANTPRRTDAYIVFGVNEDKDRGVFEHVGIPDQGFPSPERIYAHIHEYTSLRDVIIDAHYVLDGKHTPYIVIPLQYRGPYAVSRPIHGAPTAVGTDEIYCRYGSSSVRAAERDVRRMRADWDTWFLDCRYEKNATSLIGVLTKRFPAHTTLVDSGDYVRLVYDSEITDEFGTHVVPVLVHAYWGFDPVEPNAVERITLDKYQPAFQKTIVGARFSSATREAAAASTVRCIPLDEIYFVNDPYAQLCRKFVRRWADERSPRHRGLIVDLDYGLSVLTNSHNQESQTSILSFLEEQLQAGGRVAILVHGAFGCGKTTMAKQLAAGLAQDYLRGHTDLPKVLYVDVNNIDIRSRRDECIESQLAKYRLSREEIDGLITQVRDDEIHLLFDGVDEMARPYTAGGRLEAIEILRDVGNRRAAVYFVRSSYYPQLNHMIADFGRLADHDFATGKKRMVAAEIHGLRKEQVSAYLESRLGAEDAQTVRSGLHKIGLESFLGDPLIVSLVADLVEEEGTKTISSFPTRGQKAHFLSYLVKLLLQREQSKRQRHSALAGDFELFQRVLRAVAFKMICTGSSSLLPDRLEAFVQEALGTAGTTTEAVDAFRTVSWIQRSDDGALAFRHEALTIVCAAEYVCAALEHRDSLAISDWQGAAPLADVVCEYAGEIINSVAVLGAIGMLGGDTQFNVRQLASGVLNAAADREDLQRVSPDKLDARTIGTIVRGVVAAVHLARPPVRVLFRSLGEKRVVQVGVPMLWLLARLDSQEAIIVALEVLGHITERERHFCEMLRVIKEDKSNWVDSMLLKDLHVKDGDLLDSLCYETIFTRIQATVSADRGMKQYADRTLKALEGERQHRAARFKGQYEHKRRRRS